MLRAKDQACPPDPPTTWLTRAQEGEKLSDYELLKYYAKHWDRYTQGALYVHKLFNYLNKHWVKRERDEGRTGIYQVYTVSAVLRTRSTTDHQLALKVWKEDFFTHIQGATTDASRLTLAVLKQIELQRNGEVIDNSLLKKVIESYGE
jgi:cullin 1